MTLRWLQNDLPKAKNISNFPGLQTHLEGGVCSLLGWLWQAVPHTIFCLLRLCMQGQESIQAHFCQ